MKARNCCKTMQAANPGGVIITESDIKNLILSRGVGLCRFLGPAQAGRSGFFHGGPHSDRRRLRSLFEHRKGRYHLLPKSQPGRNSAPVPCLWPK
jgi:hypothetical protein